MLPLYLSGNIHHVTTCLHTIECVHTQCLVLFNMYFYFSLHSQVGAAIHVGKIWTLYRFTSENNYNVCQHMSLKTVENTQISLMTCSEWFIIPIHHWSICRFDPEIIQNLLILPSHNWHGQKNLKLSNWAVPPALCLEL